MLEMTPRKIVTEDAQVQFPTDEKRLVERVWNALHYRDRKSGIGPLAGMLNPNFTLMAP